MKFKRRIYKKGDIREKTFFAWFPVSVRNGADLETRWLEKVTVLQKRCSPFVGNKGFDYWQTYKFKD